MTLEGAKFICLDDAGNHGKIVLAKGRKFTMGYYVNCDFVLVDERARGVHCEIECDAFGRVTIRNLSSDKPIFVNGSSVEIKRILLNNSRLSILDKEYLWLFPKSSSNEFEDLPSDAATTPLKPIEIAEQPPNSCPDFKLHRDLPKRFTIHNFAYCIQSDEEENISTDSNDRSTNAETETNQIIIETERRIQIDDSNANISHNVDLDKVKINESRSITPEPNKELAESAIEILETPTMNIINCSKDKENRSTQKISNQLLTMCHQSDVVITSFSPRETGVKIEKSFAAIIKPKLLLTKPPLTPNSVYSTPKSDMNENEEDDERDLMTFHTPSTSKKGIGSAGGISAASAKILKMSSMHLIDLTTPTVLRPASSYLKSALKASTKKNITQTIEKARINLPSVGNLGISALPVTPAISEVSSSEVISINSTTDTSSVVEVTSDVSVSASTTGHNTPLKAQARTGAYTPKKTPHSLMKRALLTSAKKQATTPQLNTQNSITPRREFLNCNPVRSNLALLGTPTTPKASTGISQLPRRQSASTPTRKNVSAKMRCDNSPSTSNLGSTSKIVSRRSSINLMFGTGALPTSTPMSASRNNNALRARAACKSSPLHNVCKSIGGVKLSSHISKACRSIVVPGSNSKITSIKEKSPQQVMSDRLVSRARNSLCVTPFAKTPLQSAKKYTPIQSAKKPDRKGALFVSKQAEGESEIDHLSRTFIIDSDDDENYDKKKVQKIPKDATFSPEKELNEIKEKPTKSLKKPETVEIPVDVEEVQDKIKGSTSHDSDNKTQKSNGENTTLEEKQTNVVESESKLETNKVKDIVTEESFAEVVLPEPYILCDTIEILDYLKDNGESVATTTTRDKSGVGKISNQVEANVVETGFGEESVADSTNSGNVQLGENKNETHNLTNKTDLPDSNASISQCDQKDANAVEIKARSNETVLIKVNEEETKSSSEQEVELIKKGVDEEKSCEYKPIVEDITLEGSLTEKETKENPEIIVNKQHITTLENSQIEAKVKDEKIKQEDSKIIVKESTTISKDSEICETLQKETCCELNIMDKANISQAKESYTEINENELEEQRTQFKPSDIKSVPADTLNAHVEETSNKTEINENVQVFQTENNEETAEMSSNIESESQSTTNKLLEEIEDVLNKSDEILQKHLNDLEDCNDKPLTEEFESEQLSEENSAGGVEEEDKIKVMDEKVSNNEKIEEFSDPGTSKEEDKNGTATEENSDKIISQSKNNTCDGENKNGVSNKTTETPKSLKAFADEDKTSSDIEANIVSEKADSEETKKCVKNERNIERVEATEENSDKIISQSKNNTCDGENKNGVSNKTSETPKSLKAFADDDKTSSNIEANIVSEKADSEETKKCVKNERNIERVENSNIENIVCESDSCKEESSTIITTALEKENSPNDESDEINSSQIKSKSEMVNIDGQNTDYKSCESTVIENDYKDTEKESTVNKTGYIPELTNVSEIENNKELNATKEIVENATSFTPRRNARRASQSTDTPKLSAELTFTPRRSGRRASVSGESPLTCTPTNRSSRRRSSLSVDNETTPSTFQLITKRRVSFSIDAESNKPSSSKIQRIKTPRKPLRQSMVIPEEIDEITSVIEDVAVIIPEEIEPKTEQNNTKCLAEEHFQIDSQTNLPAEQAEISYSTDATKDCTDFINIPEPTNDDTSVILNITETKECNESSAKEYEVDEDLFSKEISLSSKVLNRTDTAKEELTELSSTNSEQKEISTPVAKATGKMLDDTTKTPLMSGMRELLKTPKAQACTPRLVGIRDLVRTPKETLESEEEELEKLWKQQEHHADDSPKTPLMTGIRELLKTPKPDAKTPRLGGIRKLVLTPKDSVENEDEEIEKFALLEDLLKTPKASISKTKKRLTIVAESPKTPSMKGVRELLQTPKAKQSTPKLGGIRNLLKTPKSNLENDEEEIEKLAVLSHLVKTPECPKNMQNAIEEMPSSSMKNELTKTPKSCAITRFSEKHELIKTPCKESSLAISDEDEGLGLLESSISNETEDLQTLTVEKPENLVSKENPEEISCETTEHVLKGVKEVIKTPKSSSTPHFKGIKELMQTPKLSSTPSLGGIKELMKTPAQQKDQELEKFLRTPAAKNIMIPSMPSSAVLEKSNDSVRVSTEYDLNATNDDGSANLIEDIFKTSMTSRFVERITESYYGEVVDEQQGETDKKFGTTETVQDTVRKSAEKAFDQLIGQDTQIQTPVRKTYTRKSFNLQTPQAQSPFTAADVLSDLPKTDIQEWIESLEQAEAPVILQCDVEGEEEKEEQDQQNVEYGINESLKQAVEAPSSSFKYSANEPNEENISLNNSFIPETCAKVYLNKNNRGKNINDSLNYTQTKDPLMNADNNLNKNDAEISGITLLDQTFESLQDDESSMLDEPLVVEEPSMFDECLIVSDDEPEADATLNNAANNEIIQDGGNNLSEPLLLSDSEDLNQSQPETEPNETVEAIDDVLETSNFDINVQEKSMLEKIPNTIHSTIDDPLETEYKEMSSDELVVTQDETLIEINVTQSDSEFEDKETAKDNNQEHSLPLTDSLLIKDMFTNENEEIEISENVKQENSEIVEILSTSKVNEVLEYPSSSQIDQTELELTVDDFENNSIIEKVDGKMQTIETASSHEVHESVENSHHVEHQTDAKEIAIEQTKVVSVANEDIFVDTSITEICEETGVLNEEQVELKENLSSAKNTTPPVTNILFDNSSIDETFADEAFTKENEASTSGAIENKTKDVSLLPTEHDNSEQEKQIPDNEAVKETEISQTKINELNREESEELYQTKENICEVKELSLQIETQSIDELESMEKNPIENISTEIPESELKQSDEKHNESKSSEILETDQEFQDENKIKTQINTMSATESLEPSDTVNKTADISTKELIQDSDVFIENSTKNEQEFSQDGRQTESESPQSEIESSRKGNLRTTQEEIIKKVEQKPLEDSSKIVMSSEPHAPTEQSFLEFKNNKSTNEAEIKNNLYSPSSNREENFNVSGEKLPSPNKSKKNKSKTAKEISEDDKLKEGNTNISPNKKAISSSKDHNKDAADGEKVEVTKELHKVETYIEKSVSHSPTQEELQTSNIEEPTSSSEVVKFDYEVKIIDTDRQKETESKEAEIKKALSPTCSQSSNTELELPAIRQTGKNLSSEKVPLEISCQTEEESIKHKCSDDKITQSSEDVKTETVEVPEVFAGVSEIKAKYVRGKRNVSESSQDLAQENHMTISSGEICRRIIENPIVEKLTEEVQEEIKDNVEILKHMIKEEEKTNKRKRNTSESSQGSVKGDDNCIRTRRGGRRNLQKTPQEETVVEQKEECEEPTLQHEEDNKVEESKKPITRAEDMHKDMVESIEKAALTMETSKDESKMLMETVTKSNQDITDQQRVSEALNEANMQSGHELIAKQIEAIAKEKQREDTEEKDGIQKQLVSVQEQISDISKITLPDSNEKLQEFITNIDVTEENIAVCQNIDKPDDVQLTQGSLSIILKGNAEREKEVSEKPSNDEVKQRTEVHVSEQIILPIVEEPPVSIEKSKHPGAKRGRRKPTVSESSQESVVEDVKTSVKITRRKVQKAPLEEVLLEEDKDAEGMVLKTTSMKTDAINLEIEKTQIEEKLFPDREETDSRDETEKRSRDNAAVSVPDDGSHTRRGRRKVQKSPLDENLREKQTEVIKKEVASIPNKIKESKQEPEKKYTNDLESITEVAKVGSNETIPDVKDDPKPKAEKSNEQHRQLAQENQTHEISKDHAKHEESKETAGGRGRNKRILQETAIEEPTTSRRGRRKGQVAKADLLNVEPRTELESDIKTHAEDVIESDAPIVIAATNKQTVTKEIGNTTTPRGRLGKIAMENITSKDDLTLEINESATSHTKKCEISNKEKLDDITATSLQEQDKTQKSLEVMSAQMNEVEHSTKPTMKRGRPAKTRGINQVTKIDESHKQDIELKHTKSTSPQEQKTNNIQSHVEDQEIEKEPPKSTRRRAGAGKHEQDTNNQQEELLIKSRKRRAERDLDENMIEPKKPMEDSLLSEVNITEVNLEVKETTTQHKSPPEVKVRRGRKKANFEDKNPEDNETLATSKRKAAIKYTEEEHSETVPLIKTRVARKKQDEEKPEHQISSAAPTDTSETTNKSRDTAKRVHEHENDSKIDHPDSEEESKHKEVSETSTRTRRNLGRRKPDYKEVNDKEMLENNKKEEETTSIEDSGDLNKQIVDKEEHHDDHAATIIENRTPLEGIKKGRGRRKKNDHQEEVEAPTTSMSSVTKPRGRKRKELHTNIDDEPTAKEEIESDEKLTQEPEKSNINILSAKIEPQTPQRSDSFVRKGRKAFEHITAESQELEDTPGRRARNVPQRRAATAYHNYVETSDSEILTKTKKKTDSPRKSLEGIKKSPTATITSATIVSASPPAASPALITTTARGRTRKPTAKVQQFLEEERAKAETPKKRALLAAAAAVAAAGGLDSVITQHTPARRGRKPSNIETAIEGTPQTSKSRGRGRPAALRTKKKEDEEDVSVVSQNIAVAEEKEIELKATPLPSNTIKGRRGVRKAKITEEDHHSSDEPPAKKPPAELQSEKQDFTPLAEDNTTILTPTRTAGRRNAAAAAKARIEEDALAAAAIEPPKRSRAKKPTPKVSTPAVATTDTDAQSSEAEPEQPARLEKEIEGLEIETEAADKPANKRGHKAVASTTTDSPAVPAKRGRKPKVVQEVADTETPGELKRGRGRKKVNLDEAKPTSTSQENATDSETASANTSEPAKKITRSRRK